MQRTEDPLGNKSEIKVPDCRTMRCFVWILFSYLKNVHGRSWRRGGATFVIEFITVTLLAAHGT